MTKFRHRSTFRRLPNSLGGDLDMDTLRSWLTSQAPADIIEDETGLISWYEVCQHLKIDFAQLKKYRSRGLSPEVADIIAVDRLGIHPYAIWGEKFYEVAPNATWRRTDESKILAIYHSTDTQVQIALQYGVSKSFVSRIKSGAYWSNVTGHEQKASA